MRIVVFVFKSRRKSQKTGYFAKTCTQDPALLAVSVYKRDLYMESGWTVPHQGGKGTSSRTGRWSDTPPVWRGPV